MQIYVFYINTGEKNVEDRPVIEEPEDGKNEEVDEEEGDEVEVDVEVNEIEDEEEEEDNDDDDDDEEDDDEDDDENDDEDDDEYDDEDDDQEEEEEEEDDQNSITFEKSASVFARNKKGGWNFVASGNLIIYYDPNIFGEKIILKADETDEVVSNTIISMTTNMKVKALKLCYVTI